MTDVRIDSTTTDQALGRSVDKPLPGRNGSRKNSTTARRALAAGREVIPMMLRGLLRELSTTILLDQAVQRHILCNHVMRHQCILPQLPAGFG